MTPKSGSLDRRDGIDRFLSADQVGFRASKLHKRLHTRRTLGKEQVDLNEKAPTCGAFAEPSGRTRTVDPLLTMGISRSRKRAGRFVFV